MISKELKKTEKLEIQSYKKPKDIKNLLKSYVPFSGTPKKHPYNPKRIIVIPDPYYTSSAYYEFKATDVAFFEELPSIVNVEGETVTMARVWINKKSVGLQCMPFIVDDTTRV
jgi:hypothetical protein